jgi:hypothetical protein
LISDRISLLIYEATRLLREEVEDVLARPWRIAPVATGQGSLSVNACPEAGRCFAE